MTQFVKNVRDRVAQTYAALGATMPGSLSSAQPARRPDAPEADATGWGTSTPARQASTSQRMVLATLAEVITRMDRPTGNSTRRQHGLPEAVVSALGGTT
jgi:hypothetical protein